MQIACIVASTSIIIMHITAKVVVACLKLSRFFRVDGGVMMGKKVIETCCNSLMLL